MISEMSTSIYQSLPVEILKEVNKRNVEATSNCMVYEFCRLGSYSSFPRQSEGRPIKLAKAGFVFTPTSFEDDTVTCFSCQVTRNSWMKVEEPFEIHKSLKPTCDFINNKSNNTSILVPNAETCDKINAVLHERYCSPHIGPDNGPPSSSPLGHQSNTDLSNVNPRPQTMSMPSRCAPLNPPTTSNIFTERMDNGGSRFAQVTTDGAELDARSMMVPNQSMSNAVLVLAGDINRETMVVEEARLRTFRLWPQNLTIRPEELARAGFYYLGSADRVQCAFCKGILRDWDEAESPVAEHWRYFSNCSFMKSITRTNVPLIPNDTFIREYVAAHPLSSGYEDVRTPINPLATILNNSNVTVSSGHNSTAEDLGIITQAAAFPEQAILATRVASFSGWPRGSLPPSKEQLAEAGFFFIGRQDAVKCFFCSGTLKSWESHDNPWHEHARWFPKCPYLQRIKGKEFVDSIYKAGQGTAQIVGTVGATANAMNIDELMNQPIVREALNFGLDRSQVQQVVERLRDQGSVFTSTQDVINAVLDLATRDTREPEVENNGSVNQIPQNQDEDVGRNPPVVVQREALLEGGNNPNPNIPEGDNEELSQLMRENTELKEQRLCKICMDAESNIVLLPCGHFAACAACAPLLTKCPICRQVVKGSVKTFLP